MKKYMLVYSGGTKPLSEEETQKLTETWEAWYTKLGSKIVDRGFTFTEIRKMTDGNRVADNNIGLSGYLLIESNNIEEVMQFARECPVIQAGAVVDVYEQQDEPTPTV